MKKTLFIAYFSFVTLALVSVAFSVFYIHILHYNLYEKYIPKVTFDNCFDSQTGKSTSYNITVGEKHYNIKADEVTKYDLLSGKLINKVTQRYAAECVPWYGMAAYRIYDFNKCYKSDFLLLAFLLYFPMLLYYKKNIAIKYWIIVALEILVSILLMYIK